MAADFSPLEIGLLTVAARRGYVRTARRVDERNDPAGIERLVVLRRLVERGLLAELNAAHTDAPELQYALTQDGQAALAEADGWRSSPTAGG
jgi:hypothetical protein